MKKISIFAICVMATVAAYAGGVGLKVLPNLSPDTAKYAVEAQTITQITALETTAKGRLWASVLCGGDGADGFLSLVYSDSKGEKWSNTIVALDAREEKLSVRNGVLWLSPKSELWLFYTVFDGYFDGRGSLWAIACKNPDDVNPVWNAPQYLGVGVATGRPIVNKLGAWMLPSALWGRDVISYDKTPFIANQWDAPRFVSPYVEKYTELDAKRGAGVYISTDEGKSWSENLGVVKCANEVINARYNNPQMFCYNDGKVGMVVRASGTAWSYVSTSTNGKEWSAVERFVAAPDQNFAVHRLADGKLLMVRNGRFDRHLYWLPEGLYAYLSEDCGQTWYGGLRLASDVATVNPVVAEAKDGAIYIAMQCEPDAKSENSLVVTSVAEIDAANANVENTPASKRVVLTAGSASEGADARTKAITAPKSDWASADFRLATYNIQYPVGGWPEKRLEPLLALLNEYDFDIFGVQEPYMPQIELMMQYIGDEYAWVGRNVTGDDNDRKHHFNPIFYRKSRFELLDYDTVWLSDKAGTPGYGARSCRLFIWAKFRDKMTDKVFYHFNGHYDHRGVEARIVSSYILLDMVRKVAKGMPAFVTADFNSNEKSEAYKVLQTSSILADTMDNSPVTVNKECQSISGYKPITTRPANGMHIDHVFYTPNSIKIKHWELIVKDYNGYWGSDHHPIFVDCTIAN